jgi:hypothetical protein
LTGVSIFFVFLGAFLAGVIIYISVTLPTLRTVVAPLEMDSISDQRDALAVLAAGNTLIVVSLGAVLFLQVSTHLSRVHTCS